MHQSLNGTLSIYLTNEIDSVKLHCMFAHSIPICCCPVVYTMYIYVCTYVCTCVCSGMYSIVCIHTYMYYVCIAMWSILGHHVRSRQRKYSSIAFSFPVFCFTVDSEERKSASRDKCVATFFIIGLFVCLLPTCSSGCGVLYECMYVRTYSRVELTAYMHFNAWFACV